MGLVGNYSVISKSPGKFLSGTTVAADRSNCSKSGQLANRFGVFAQFSAIPNGHLPSSSWALPRIGGGLATYTYLTGNVSLSADLVRGVNISANIPGVLSKQSIVLDQIVSLEAAIAGSITISNGDMAAVAGMAAAFSGAISTTDAALGAVVSMNAALSAVFGISDAAIFATADMTASISSVTELSPSSLANAVWDTVLAEHAEVGTTGKALSDVSGGSSPETIADAVHSDGRALTVAKFLGLK